MLQILHKAIIQLFCTEQSDLRTLRYRRSGHYPANYNFTFQVYETQVSSEIDVNHDTMIVLVTPKRLRRPTNINVAEGK